MHDRNDRIDNIRCLLIAAVVIGHLLEYLPRQDVDLIYRYIYTFHMPVFIFISGYLGNFKPQKVLLSLIWPYFLFQTLYRLFDGYILSGAQKVTLSYTTPYWIMWYLLALICYYMLIPLLREGSPGAKLGMFTASVAVSLIAGYEDTVGYYLSLSRFFCFLPFFVAGYYLGRRQWAERMQKRRKLLVILGCAVFLLFAQSYVLMRPEIFSRNVLYGSYSYHKENYTWLHRALLLGIGFACTAVLFLGMPRRKIPVLSVIGRNTLPIFLFHGFLVRLIGKLEIFRYSVAGNLLLAVGIALVLLLVFGNPVSAWICKWFFTGHWITVLQRKPEKVKR